MREDNTVQSVIRDQIRDRLEDPFGLEHVTSSPLDSQIKEDIMDSGVGVFGAGGTGKSNLVKIITSQLHRDPDIQLKIFDKAQNWVHSFEEILYQDLTLRTLKDVGFYFGDQPILYNCKIATPRDIRKIISDIVTYDYEYHWALKEIDEMNRWIVYVIEEAQNILGSLGTYDIWNTFISEGRNFNMAFIFIARRMAQLSTKARENMQSFIWGRMLGDNDLRKVKSISSKEIASAVQSLPNYEFIYYSAGNAYRIVDTPLYEASGSPVRWIEDDL